MTTIELARRAGEKILLKIDTRGPCDLFEGFMSTDENAAEVVEDIREYMEHRDRRYNIGVWKGDPDLVEMVKGCMGVLVQSELGI